MEELKNTVFEVMQLLRVALGQRGPTQSGKQPMSKKKMKMRKMRSGSRPHGGAGEEAAGVSAGGGGGAGHAGAAASSSFGVRSLASGVQACAIGAGGHAGNAMAGNPALRVEPKGTTAASAAGPSRCAPAGWKVVTRKPAKVTSPSMLNAEPSAQESGPRNAPSGRLSTEAQDVPQAETTKMGVELPPTGWSVKVLPSAKDLVAGGSGVALASTAEAMSAKTQLRAASGALAVVLCRPMAGAAPIDIAILQNGKHRVQRCFVLQLGSVPVTYQPVGVKLQAPSAQTATEVVALAMEKGHTEEEHWKAAETNPVITFARWLKHHGLGGLEVFRPQKEGTGKEGRITALARIPKASTAKALNASGADGVFVKTLGAQTLAVVWLEKSCTRKDAWGMAQRHMEAMGLVLGRGSLGVRCTREEQPALARALTGKDVANQRSSTFWQITGLPLEANPEIALQTIAQHWPWEAVFIRAFVRGNQRHVVAKASQAPPEPNVFLGDWLLGIAPMDGQVNAPKTSVTFAWHKPSSGPRAAATAWTDVVVKPGSAPADAGPGHPGTTQVDPSTLQEQEEEEDACMLAVPTPQAVKRLRA